MIYLIDDKKERQHLYGWNDETFNAFSAKIKVAYDYQDIFELEASANILQEGNTVIFHESFFRNTEKLSNVEHFSINENKLIEFARANSGFTLILFSGSISSRKKNKNITYIPVSVLYRNLVHCLSQPLESPMAIEYLLFGNNPKIEEKIKHTYVQKTNSANQSSSHLNTGLNLFIQQDSISYKISKPLKDATEVGTGKEVDDLTLNNKIDTWLKNRKYDNIFIPLCFGSTFADFQGLRLATLIRCTRSINQTTNIYIYNFLDTSEYLDYLLEEECFNILKTKNVELIDYSKAAFEQAALKETGQFTIQELPYQLNKLSLSIPSNFEDNHSIANEFGIYQLAYNAGIDIKDISDFESEKLESLYFKWLVAKNGLLEELAEEQKVENKHYGDKLRGLKVVSMRKDLINVK